MSYWDNTKNFNPLPPYGGRLSTSIIAPNIGRNFNPLPPYGGRPQSTESIAEPESISIHSLRMEGDLLLISVLRRRRNFNPLPPYGGRPPA